MPDPLRVRPGNFDDPPASSEASTPQTRRSRLRRALQTTSDLASASQPRNTEMGSAERRRLGIIGPTSRRRRRSESTHDEQPRLSSPGNSEDRRRKRRRFESPPPVPKRKSIKYGYYGQVEPGRLKLELVSCDGGEHRDPRNTGISLGPENILRYDKSVYCSEQRSSTIVVRHADDTAFALEMLHIVAPEHGFTAPIRAGVVHVAMNMADLQKYIDSPPHARRARVASPPYMPPARRSTSIQGSPERLTLADALRDPEVNAAFGDREQDYGRSADGVHDLATNANDFSLDPGGRPADPDNHCDVPSPEAMANGDSTSHDSERNPIILSFDEETGPEETSPQDVLDFRLQRLRMMRRRVEMDSWDREDRWAGLSRMPSSLDPSDRERLSVSRLDALMARSRVHDDTPPGNEDELAAMMPSEEELLERTMHVRPGSDDKNVTTGRFFLSKGRTKVTLKFDPPVSGRFIMMRCWSGKSNVDVQAVIAKGFGGPRFFPAMEVR
ncbi:uncharacterized protein LTR77_007248 [Saxophila tyrrhenica]|uniref:Uncharacterized protein n=1 Tax=Saxophila tyrrhenica TaxID=1690608 RepID=A0AAV9P414_9PEZI|nr:hypothetical protein LTR77_007248 [Saxophila tyrrhenica]